MKVKSLNSATPCDPMDWSLPGSSVHGIFQVKVLEWVAISFSTIRVTQIGRKQLQKTDFTPSAPLKIEEQDKRQRKGFSPPQPINNSWEIKIQPGNKIQGNKLPPLFVLHVASLSHKGPCAEAPHLALQTGFLVQNTCSNTSAQLRPLRESIRHNTAIQNGGGAQCRNSAPGMAVRWELCSLRSLLTEIL